jgi:hypothetical protein
MTTCQSTGNTDKNTTIKTNNKPLKLLCWADLTALEQGEMGYFASRIKDGDDSDAELRFVRYKGWVYDVYDMMTVRKELLSAGSPFAGWDAYANDSFFSGVLVKWVHGADDESVVMATFFS